VRIKIKKDKIKKDKIKERYPILEIQGILSWRKE
jgi:hypothetical protein